MKRILLFLIILSQVVFGEFDFSLYIPLGAMFSSPKIDALHFGGIYLENIKSDASIDVGVTANFGHKFNINSGNFISILTEIGYQRVDFASSYFNLYEDFYTSEKQNLVFHTLNIGIMPKYGVDLDGILKNTVIGIGIGFGIKIALAYEYYSTIDNRNHLKYSFKDIKEIFDCPFMPYVKFQIDYYFYFSKRVAFLFGVEIAYDFGMFYSTYYMSREYCDFCKTKKYGFSGIEYLVNLGIKVGR